MGAKTGIEWTDSTWNPLIGCTRVSEGCRNCYAERLAHRFQHLDSYSGTTHTVNGHPAWTGKVMLVEEHLLDPLKWGPVALPCARCGAIKVPFFFKQWGEWVPLPHREDLPGRPVMVCTGDTILEANGTRKTFDECGGIGDGIPMRRVGKKAAGSLLDGREWKEFPR